MGGFRPDQSFLLYAKQFDVLSEGEFREMDLKEFGPSVLSCLMAMGGFQNLKQRYAALAADAMGGLPKERK